MTHGSVPPRDTRSCFLRCVKHVAAKAVDVKTGLCSITFRHLAAEEVVELTASAGLDAVEWGGDIHAPPGAGPAKIEEIGRMTRDAGLFVSSYGSYHRVMQASDHPGSFEPVLDAAQALGAPVIRVWTSGVESAAADDAWFAATTRRVADLAAMAAERNATVAFEFHQNTLTDTAAGVRRLIETVGMDNVRTYWQPLRGRERIACEEEIRELLPWLVHVHCYHWADRERLPLDSGRDVWQPLLAVLAEATFENVVLLEFTKGDDPENMRRDAATLKDMVSAALEDN